MRKNKVVHSFLALLLLTSMVSSPIAINADDNSLIINNSETGSGLNKISFSEGWKTSTGYPDRFYNGDEHWFNFKNYDTSKPLPSYSIDFKGTGIELYGEKQPSLGIYNIYLDGKKIDTVDAYHATRVSKVKLYEVKNIKYGNHTIKVELSNTKNKDASAPDGEIDYIKIIDAGKAPFDGFSIIEDMAITKTDELFKIKYNGEWSGGTSYYPDMFHDGYEHYAHTGDSYEMKFIGTKFELYASKDPGHGTYTVTIDGVEAGVADGTATARKHQQLIYTSPELEDKEHTMKVELKGQEGKAIQLDYIKAYHKEIAPASITLNKKEVRLESGQSTQITTSITPAVATNKEVVWTSADEDIASVDDEGTIKAIAKKDATTTITATIKGTNIKADVIVNVVPAVEFMSASVGSSDSLNTQDDYEALLSQYDGTWSDTGWKGDVLNSKINILTRDKKVHNASISASDFTSGSSTIKAKNVEIKWLKEVLANIGRGNSGAPVKPFPDVIYKEGKLDIDAEKLQSAWLNIHIPKDAVPGIYQGKITVSADELKKDYVFNYQFEVLDITQPENDKADTQLQIWQHPFSVANYYGLEEKDYFTEKHYTYMRASMKEYKSLGGKDVVANIVEEAWNHQSYYSDPSMVKWTKKADGTLTFDYTWYDSWINFQIENGLLDPATKTGQIKCYSIVPWNNQIAYYDEAQDKIVKKSYKPGSQAWTDMWKPFLEDFMKHSKAKGWFDITYIAMDERGLSELRPAVELIDSIKDEQGKRFKISSAFNYSDQSDYSFTDKIDDISIGVGHVDHDSQKMRDMSAHRKELGLITTLYACTGDYPGNFTISDPAENAWMMWYTMSHKADGFMRWAWDNWVPDPLTNVTYKYWEPGDGWFIYPVEKGSTSATYFYSTPRYEMLKEGIRDINKAKYLQSLDGELAKRVEALVSSIERPQQGGNGYGSATAASFADRELLVGEVTRMREGLHTLTKEYLASKHVPVLDIQLDTTEVTLMEGEQKKVQASVTPDNATNKTLLWESDNADIATVKEGLITAVKEGTTSIRVRSVDGDITKTIQVVVKAATPIDPIPPIQPDETITIPSIDGNANITGNFDKNHSFTLQTLSIDATKAIQSKITDKEFLKNWRIERVYDFRLMKEGIQVNPDGTFTLRIKLEDALKNKSLQVVKLSDTGSVVFMKSTIKNGYIEFTTEHNGMYALVSKQDVPTGDQTNLSALTMISVVSALGILVLRKKKHMQ